MRGVCVLRVCTVRNVVIFVRVLSFSPHTPHNNTRSHHPMHSNIRVVCTPIFFFGGGGCVVGMGGYRVLCTPPLVRWWGATFFLPEKYVVLKQCRS